MVSSNPLISGQESSASNLEVSLHPLALLSISDYITRHTLRRLKGPIVGALLGQQKGREVTIEQAFECLMVENNGEISLNQSWFEDRLQQMRDVHKEPLLDIVGWYTTLPSTGPLPVHLPTHRQILQLYNESALLLGFHPSAITELPCGGKLPLTIYESSFETDNKPSTDGEEDKDMEDESSQSSLKFREISYSIETGEAEMISVAFVAQGGSHATTTDGAELSSKVSAREQACGKEYRAWMTSNEKSEQLTAEERILSREEEDLIAFIVAKANAIKMLKSRIDLIASYLRDAAQTDGEENIFSHSVLRSIQALLRRLELLVPSDSAGYEQEFVSEKNDVNFVSLLNTITESVKDIKEVGMKHGIVEASKTNKNKSSNQWGSFSHMKVSGVGELIS